MALLLEAVSKEKLSDGSTRIVIDLPMALRVLYEGGVLKEHEPYSEAVNKTIAAVRAALVPADLRQFRLVGGPKTHAPTGAGLGGVDPTVKIE